MKQNFKLSTFLQSLNETPKKTAVVFDLDSTLFNVSPRTQHILETISDHPFFVENFPEEVQHLKNVKVVQTDWGIRTAIERSGLKATLGFFERVREYWMKHFFSSDFLMIDEPYEGAVEFVNALFKCGVPVYYLTGRDIDRMGRGTHEVLNKRGFPHNEHFDNVYMKPDQEMNDAEFKRDILKRMATEFEQIYFFENEPVIIHLIREQVPSINIIFVDTIHSGRAAAPADLPTIKNFKL